MKFKEVATSNASTEAKVAALALLLDKELIKLADTVLNVKKLEGPKGEQGIQGPKGEQGDRGFDGTNGKDGADGKDGKDGEDGKQGVGVADAKIDFDGSLVITLTDGTEINAGDVVPLDTAEKIRVIGNGGGTSQSVLDAIDAINAIISTYGTMALQDDTAVDINGGAIDGTAIGASSASTGTFTALTASALTATGQTSLGGAAGSEGLRVTPVASSVNWVEIAGDSSVYPSIKVAGTASAVELRMSSKGGGSVGFFTNNLAQRQLNVSHTASAVNYVQVTGAATTGIPVISSQGSDTNIGLTSTSKGTGSLIFRTNNNAQTQFTITHTGSAVNYWQATGAAAGSSPVLSVVGSDTNVSMAFQSKGTGAIDLAAGSRGVNISNGGTVTALTRTGSGVTYTSVPSIIISAPTTAGGVQATANPLMSIASAAIVSGGTGYSVNDVLTLSGATGTVGQLTVNTVSGGVITGVTVTLSGSMSALPTNPASVTGGTGSGATFTVLYGLSSLVGTITNAGSGYVEQPTVSFSGGGGSGAAAYASVGAATVIKTLFGTATSGLDLSTPAGAQVRIADIGDGTRPLQLNGGSAGSTQIAGIYNATSGASLGYSTNTGTHAFYTGGRASNSQFQIAHTASAVNYVQVTGAATGAGPTISAQGSDSAANLLLIAKGGSSVVLQTRGGGTPRTAFLANDNGSNSVNYLQAASNNAGSAPILSSQGSDTNIDLTLTPKGTGNVRFGTYTATMALTVQGYIEIKDSGGTVRKLAVIA